jgi:FkbH-like protein
VVTDEDRRRAVMYDSKREREQLKVSAQSIEDFLHSLELVVDIAPASEATLPRVQQLIQRTNQFNLTTRRYEAAELAAMSRDPDWRIYTARARDKFGDHGLVATALAHAEGPRWRIDSFLMSCRVIGYGVETALLAALSEDARAAGASTLLGEFVPTKKNAPAREFYALHGFAPDGATGWVRSLADGPVDSARWIRSTADTGA